MEFGSAVLVKKIGEGVTGQVWKTQISFAIKVLKEDADVNILERESFFLDLFKDCKYIVDGFGIHPSPKGQSLVMEFLDGVSLETVFRKHQKKQIPISSKQMEVIMISVFKGLNVMHCVDVVHRDIKDENIFFTRDVIKIIDLGFACFCNKKGKFNLRCTNVVGSPLFFAPEMYVDTPKKKGWYNKSPPNGYPLSIRKDLSLLKKLDIWAVGALCWELVSLDDPPNAKNVFSQNDLDVMLKDELEGKINTQFVNIIHNVMAFDPHNRPTTSDILDMLNAK